MKRWYILTLIALVGPAAWGGPARLSFRHLSGPLYLATDAEYFPTNWLVYVGPKTVTVVGATWTPAMARTLSMRIRQVTRLPITAVIDTSPDPEWSGGNAYWNVGDGRERIGCGAALGLAPGTWVYAVGDQLACLVTLLARPLQWHIGVCAEGQQPFFRAFWHSAELVGSLRKGEWCRE